MAKRILDFVDGFTSGAEPNTTTVSDSELAALAGLTSAADALPYFTGSGTAATTTLTAAARTVLDDTTVAAMVDTLGGASSTGTGGLVRATSPTLVTPALGTPSALVGTNITGTAAGLTAGTVTTNANLTGPITSVGNATTIADAELAALAGLTSAADALPYFTGSGTAAVTTMTAAARTVLDDTTVAAMVDTLGGASSTGTGGIARATSPTFVTPALGTPSAAVLTNATGLPTGGMLDEAVTYAKMQHVSAESKLLGRGEGGGAGDVQEITLGSGLAMSGTTISATGAASLATGENLVLSGGNGNGSTNTACRRFSTNTVNGTSMTYADSATNGATVTINEAGIYYISYSDRNNAGNTEIGISKNSSNGATSPSNLAIGELMAFGVGNNSNWDHITYVGELAVNDVIRFQNSGANQSGSTATQARMTKIG